MTTTKATIRSDGQSIELTDTNAFLDGIEHKHKVTASDGLTYLLKYVDAEMESDALTVGRLLRANVPSAKLLSDAAICSACPTGEAIAIEWIEGATTYRDQGVYSCASRDVRIIILDYVIANTDRHAGNIMAMADGRDLAIDHGFSFGATAYQDVPVLDEILLGLGRDNIEIEAMAEELSMALDGFPSLLGGQDRTETASARLRAVVDFLNSGYESDYIPEYEQGLTPNELMGEDDDCENGWCDCCNGTWCEHCGDEHDRQDGCQCDCDDCFPNREFAEAMAQTHTIAICSMHRNKKNVVDGLTINYFWMNCIGARPCKFHIIRRPEYFVEAQAMPMFFHEDHHPLTVRAKANNIVDAKARAWIMVNLGRDPQTMRIAEFLEAMSKAKGACRLHYPRWADTNHQGMDPHRGFFGLDGMYVRP